MLLQTYSLCLASKASFVVAVLGFYVQAIQGRSTRADLREGDEDSNFSIFSVQWFTEWPRPLHGIAFRVEILTQPLIH